MITKTTQDQLPKTGLTSATKDGLYSVQYVSSEQVWVETIVPGGAWRPKYSVSCTGKNDEIAAQTVLESLKLNGYDTKTQTFTTK